MSIEQIFLTEAADKLAENLKKIEACVAKLPDGVVLHSKTPRLVPGILRQNGGALRTEARISGR